MTITRRETLGGALAASVTLVAGKAFADEVGLTKDQILIGGYGPITGPAAYIGLGARDGTELAMVLGGFDLLGARRTEAWDPRSGRRHVA